jgi:hypothetical protein
VVTDRLSDLLLTVAEFLLRVDEFLFTVELELLLWLTLVFEFALASLLDDVRLVRVTVLSAVVLLLADLLEV